MNFTVIQEIFNVIIMLIHVFLLVTNLKVLLNTNQYDAGTEIKLSSSVRTSCWYKFLMGIGKMVEFLVVCEPLLILFESQYVLGFHGSVCRGDYERPYKLKYYSDCEEIGTKFETCKAEFNDRGYQYLANLGSWYKYTVYAKIGLYAT